PGRVRIGGPAGGRMDSGPAGLLHVRGGRGHHPRRGGHDSTTINGKSGMTGNERFRGVGVALVTPFHANGALDLDALARHAERMIEGGVDYLVPCGTTGESATMDLREQADVIRATVAAAAGRVPVVAGAGGNATADAVAKARAAADAGADALLSVAPYYNKPPQEGLYRH